MSLELNNTWCLLFDIASEGVSYDLCCMVGLHCPLLRSVFRACESCRLLMAAKTANKDYRNTSNICHLACISLHKSACLFVNQLISFYFLFLRLSPQFVDTLRITATFFIFNVYCGNSDIVPSAFDNQMNRCFFVLFFFLSAAVRESQPSYVNDHIGRWQEMYKIKDTETVKGEV